VFAAIDPIFCAIASCCPIGRPHCTRSAASGGDLEAALGGGDEEIGSVNRPV